MFEAAAEVPDDDVTTYDAPRRPRLRLARSAPAADIAYAPSQYAPSTKKSWLPFVIGGHLVLLWAVMHFDVHHRHHHHRHRMQVNLVPLEIVPPPKVSPPASKQPVKVQTPIVAPPTIVSPPITQPQTVMTTPEPVKIAPVTTTAAPALPVVAEAAPITAPDGFAANLGNTAPKYPTASRMAHEEGTVRLRVLISAAGMVDDISIARSSGFDRLDKAALDAVRKWRFRPGTQAGTAIEAVGFLSIPFKLTR